MLVKRSLGSVKLISIDKKVLFKVLNETAIRIKEENSELIDIKLFGSIAKKEDTGKSDVDIIIIVSDSSEDIFHRSLKFRRYFDIQVPVDVLVYTKPEIEQLLKEGNNFIENILNESISLIAKEA
ncbi:MAG: nucleotidyltransferase domain-containing protein [Nitrospirae bacterium]|nr:nucleotidyltransferase domain-containing protein [Nitrospirota bacterium]